MSIIQAVLCAVLYFLGRSTFFPAAYYTIYRPLIGGLLTGVILGDPVKGVMVGATINLMYIGFISVGGALPGDMCLAGILGTALAISGGLDTEAALAIAVPIGLIGTIIFYLKMTGNSVFVRLVDHYIETGQPEKIWIADVLLPQAFLFLITAVPCFLACYFGANYIQGIINTLGGTVLNVMAVIGGIMPALGIGLTLMYIFKGEARVFFFIGFLLTAYFNTNMVMTGFFALCITIVYMQLKNAKKGETNV